MVSIDVSPYGRSAYLVHAVLRSWLPAMPSMLDCHSPSQTSLSGQAGVVATATGADEPWDPDAGPGVVVDFEDAHPATTIAMQRNTRNMHTIAECFIESKMGMQG
jgi:hypothetical protein